MIKNKSQPFSYVYALKCKNCQLEFVIFSWKDDWADKNQSFCPECGKQDIFFLYKKSSKKPIFELAYIKED